MSLSGEFSSQGSADASADADSWLTSQGSSGTASETDGTGNFRPDQNEVPAYQQVLYMQQLKHHPGKL